MTYESYQARKFIPELDGLRALSVLLVISVHMHDRVWEWLVGWLGVDVFFVLSGYLITMLALREEAQRGSLSLTAFYLRRSFRIFPLYYFVLAVYCVLILGLGLNPEKRELLRGALPYYLLYLQEIPFTYGVADAAGVVQRVNVPFYQSWSLGIEEKFYLVWPLLAFVWWRGRRVLRLVGTLALALGFALVPWCAVRMLGPGQKVGDCLYPYYNILAGCVVGVLLHDRRWFAWLQFLGRPVVLYASLSVWLALHFSLPALSRVEPVPYLVQSLYGLVVSVFLTGLVLGDGPVNRFLRLRSLTFIGRLSYGIYLVHVLALNVAQVICWNAARRLAPDVDVDAAGTRPFLLSAAAYALAMALSVAVAYVLHRLIEAPCIEVGRRWSRRVMVQEAGAVSA